MFTFAVVAVVGRMGKALCTQVPNLNVCLLETYSVDVGNLCNSN